MIFLFLGFPYSLEKILAILTGILVIFMAYRIKLKESSPAGGSPFKDNLSSDTEKEEQSNNISSPDAEQ